VALTWLFIYYFYLFVTVHIIFIFLKYLKNYFSKIKKSKKYSDSFPKNLKIKKIQIFKKSEKIFGFF